MTQTWVRELAGWVIAAAVGLITAATVASSARAELLFRDGDSLIVALFARSLQSGEHLDWAMSSVLFVPETAAFAALDAILPVGVNSVLAASAVVNLLALYGAVRVVAGRSREGAAPVTWSVIAIVVFGVLAMTEMSASRDALELASLQLTTTYYSATVVAVVLSIGLARRTFDRPTPRLSPLIALAVVSALATFSNPLYAAWATAPVGLLLAVAAVRVSLRARSLMLIAVLIGGTTLGMLARLPLGPWIANTGAGYVQPAQWRESLDYYGQLLGERLQGIPGIAALAITLALIALAVLRSARRRDPGEQFVAMAAWAMPALVVGGAIIVGTHAARYLQPVAFAPMLALVAAPQAIRMPRIAARAVVAVTGIAVLVGGGLSVPRLSSAAGAPDPDLTCVTDWVSASGRTGAGQFWTVRLPKLHLHDPSHLVQVDHRLNGYAWLVNRTDFDVGAVSFLVEDAQTVPWDLSTAAVPEMVVECGRYSILDFGSQTLPLGPQRS